MALCAPQRPPDRFREPAPDDGTIPDGERVSPFDDSLAAVRKLDPDPRPRSAYSIVVNRVLDEMYLRSPGTTEFVFSTAH